VRWLGIGMMVAAVVMFVALLPRGNELRLKSDNAQSAVVMALIMLFVLGGVFALGGH
jgi:hypothetical protein